MHKHTHGNKPHHEARGRAGDFPSHTLIRTVFEASNSGSDPQPAITDREILTTSKKLWDCLNETLLEMARFSENQEIKIIDDGDLPSDDFAIKMLHRLHLVGHHNEKKILELIGSELMAWMVYYHRKAYLVGDSHELAYDHDGDTLVLRRKTVVEESPFRPYKDDRAAA